MLERAGPSFPNGAGHSAEKTWDAFFYWVARGSSCENAFKQISFS